MQLAQHLGAERDAVRMAFAEVEAPTSEIIAQASAIRAEHFPDFLVARRHDIVVLLAMSRRALLPDAARYCALELLFRLHHHKPNELRGQRGRLLGVLTCTAIAAKSFARDGLDMRVFFDDEHVARHRILSREIAQHEAIVIEACGYYVVPPPWWRAIEAVQDTEVVRDLLLGGVDVGAAAPSPATVMTTHRDGSQSHAPLSAARRQLEAGVRLVGALCDQLLLCVSFSGRRVDSQDTQVLHVTDAVTAGADIGVKLFTDPAVGAAILCAAGFGLTAEDIAVVVDPAASGEWAVRIREQERHLLPVVSDLTRSFAAE